MTILAHEIGEPEIQSRCGPTPMRGVAGILKRAIDIVVSAVLLVVLAPVLIAAAVAVKLDSPGPAIYRAPRIGAGGRPITVFKMRSMHVDCDHTSHRRYVRELIQDAAAGAGDRATFKLQNDPRVTRVGRLLRRSSIDELPQLVNVLLGSMSLVGPRPEVAEVLDVYEPWMFRRFACRPGMSGLWQVRGRSGLPPREMLRLDVEYVDTWRISLDLRIMALTPMRALFGRAE